MREKVSSKVLALLVGGFFLAGCGVDGDLTPQVNKDSIFPVKRVKAEGDEIDRSKPDWLRDYCFSRLEEEAIIPVSYERKRGPLLTFEPVFRPGRYSRARSVETCNLDYYMTPVIKEAFLDMNMEFSYSGQAWQLFEDAVMASVSAKLVDDGFAKVSVEEEAGTPIASYKRTDWAEGLGEYVDVFVTDFEEIVFEMLVVEI